MRKAAGAARTSVVQPFQVPRAAEAVEVHERQPALPDDLAVVALDRLAPPGFGHPPGVADLDRLALAVPADRHEPAAAIQLHVDRGMLAQEPGHEARHVQRRSASGASGSVTTAFRTRSSP